MLHYSVYYIGTSAHRSLLAEKLVQAVYRGADGLVYPGPRNYIIGWVRGLGGSCQTKWVRSWRSNWIHQQNQTVIYRDS